MTQTQALLASLVLEVPLVLGVAAALGWCRGRGPLVRLLLVACAATLVTHPFAWHAFRGLAPLIDYWPRAALVEGAVALTEGLLFARVAGLGARRGLALGFSANAFSYGLGLVLWRLLEAG